jgi:hypothetical protein
MLAKNMKRKLLSLLTTAAMVTTLFAGMTIGASATNGTWAGSGTSADPYQIADLADLNAIASGVTSSNDYAGTYFILTNNIDTTTGTWNGIGISNISSASTNSPYENSSAIPFSGILDGSGYTITVNRSVSTSGQGGVINYLGPAGTLKNLNVTGSVTATGSVDAIGGVVGYNSGVIDHVTSSVVVSAESAFNVGGIVGFNNGYYNTSGTALVSGTDTINGYILNSANIGNVTGYRKVGGISGENSGTINSCSNIATVVGKLNAKNGVGGIAGSNGNKDTAYESGKIWNCYNTGSIICSSTGGVTTNSSYLGSWVGGICGFQNSLSNCVNCYNRGNLTGYNYRDHIAGKNEGIVSNCYGYSGATGAQLYDGATIVSDTNSTDFVNHLNKGAAGFWKQGTTTAELNKVARTDSDNPATNTITFTMYSAPFQTTYAVGETFDMAGTVIRAYNTNGTFTEVTGFSASNTSALTASDTSVTISGSYGDQTYSFNIPITVRTPSIYYLDTSNGDDYNNSGTAYNDAFKTLDVALAAATGAGDIIQVMNTVTIGGSVDITKHNNVVFKRYSGFTGTMFDIVPNASNYVRLTTMRIDGSGVGTIFNVTSGTLNLRGGIILKNCVTGVNVGTNGTLEVNKALISASTNSIVNAGTLTINDYGGTTIIGTISNSGTATMNGGKISGFTSTGNGGGLNLSGGTFTMSGGTISGNTAVNGGGIYIGAGTFTMSGGTIGGTATGAGNNAAYGGGVYVASSGTFTMTGGTITGDAATTAGSGVYVSAGATFNYAGRGIASGQVVYLSNTNGNSDAYITLTAVPSTAMTIQCANPADDIKIAQANSSTDADAAVGYMQYATNTYDFYTDVANILLYATGV